MPDIKRVYLSGNVESWLPNDVFIQASGWRGKLREDYAVHHVHALFSHAVIDYFAHGPESLKFKARETCLRHYESIVKIDFPNVTHADALIVFGASENDPWLEFTLRDVAWAYGRIPIVLVEDSGTTLPSIIAMASATLGTLDDALEFTLLLPAQRTD